MMAPHALDKNFYRRQDCSRSVAWRPRDISVSRAIWRQLYANSTSIREDPVEADGNIYADESATERDRHRDESAAISHRYD